MKKRHKVIYLCSLAVLGSDFIAPIHAQVQAQEDPATQTVQSGEITSDNRMLDALPATTSPTSALATISEQEATLSYDHLYMNQQGAVGAQADTFTIHQTENGFYTIQNNATNSFLATTTQNGQESISMVPFEATDTAQQWIIAKTAQGTYTLQNIAGHYLVNQQNQLQFASNDTTGWTITVANSETTVTNETSSTPETTPSTPAETTTSTTSDASLVQSRAASNVIQTTAINDSQVKVTILNPNNGNATNVKFPTWSEANGQDDIKWLDGTKNADGSWSVVVNAAEFKHAGKFNTHVYATVNGKQVGLGTTSYTLSLPAANTIQTTPISKTQMKVTIFNPNNGNVSAVKFPTWSEENGQDDLKWIEGTRNDNGSWSAIVNSAEFKHAGKYNTHVYGVADGKQIGLGTTTYTLELPAANMIQTTPIGKNQMKITIFNPNNGNVSAVKFPTWSNTNGQDDLHWVEASKEANGGWSVVINVADFNHGGMFTSHAYGVVGGKLVGLGAVEYTLEMPAANAIETTRVSATKMRITIFNPNNGNVSAVKFPTWSDTNGQDDLIWLNGSRNANGSWSVVVDSSDFNHGGNYTTDIYGIAGGKQVGLGRATYNLSQTSSAAERKRKTPFYYSQLDSRWESRMYGRYDFGSTGCVPSSMAMVLKGCYGLNVTPIDTANRIYSYGGFNQQYYGASGPDLVRGMASYGRTAQVLNSVEELNEYLAKGYPVIMYVNVGIGHAVVAHGYSNGTTTVYDPYGHKFFSGQVSTSHLWSIPSRDYVDWQAGRPFFVIK